MAGGFVAFATAYGTIDPMTTDPHTLAALTLRLDDSTQRLRDALDSPDPIVANAAVGDWLDAVYAAMAGRWKAHKAAIIEARETDRDAQVVAGLVHARGRTTKDWVALTQLEDRYEDIYRDYYGAWCWVRDDRPDSLLAFYTEQLEGKLVSETIEPAVRWVRGWPAP